MKYALLMRKLIINGNTYYQVLDKVICEGIEFDYINVLEGEPNYVNLKFDSIYHIDSKEIGYFEIDEEFYNQYENNASTFFKKVNNGIESIQDANEEINVLYEFFKTFKDFPIIPDYNIYELIKKLEFDLKRKLIGQDEAIFKFISKLYNNQMFFESDIDYSEMYKNKSNILLMGPIGTGKTSIKEILKDNLSPIPIIEHKITGNFEKDIFQIIKKLIISANENMFLAERGIVIFDGLDSLSGKIVDMDNMAVNIYLETLERILKTTKIYARMSDGDVLEFNYSLVTNICIIDIDYDYDSSIKKKDECFYSRISPDTLMELGITPDLLIDSFDDEIIFMNEMTKELAIRILKDKNISPLYILKRSLESKGKTVKISKDFAEELIDFGLDLNEGFTGITRALKYVLQSKNIDSKVITFKADDFCDLKIGTTYMIINDSSTSYNKSNDRKKSKKIDDFLDVDIKKRTINKLTKKQTVERIKEKIKGQDEHVFNVVNTFYEFVFNKRTLSDIEFKEVKDNILLIGGTGVGKTAIIETLARIFSIPYKRVDATNYSSTGLVGNDVDSILKELVESCGGDPRKAEHAIVFLDEFDKIASSFDRVDIGKGVQNALLTIVEGSVRRINPDLKENFSPYDIDTSKILFIGAGAFEGIIEIKNNRIKKEKNGSTLGFKDVKVEKQVRDEIITDDIARYGIDRQLVARMPNIINLNLLGEDNLFDIVDSEQGYVNLKRKSYAANGIKIEMSEGFKRNLAKAAYLDKKGARSIKTVFKRILNEIDKNNLDDSVEQVILDDNSLDDYKTIQYVKKIKK